ncbi:MAG: sigma-70 family RNA polymerase sigma factor [Gemmataceae bacterium]|nr:sigma-70 family RNA polymerase sigma factor [Gemmataceae bacterium]MDW8243359.1 sigma-70 family RNA polymerase sigma factor [Thermogemmata sp.]
MSTPQPFGNDHELVAAYQAGSDTAAHILFDRYCEKLLRLAQRRIGQRLASRIDPEDIIQSAFRTFFVHLRKNNFTFAQESDLFKLLVRLTVHKTLRQIAHHRAAKRDPQREIIHALEDRDLSEQLVSHEPPPEAEVMLLEEMERFLRRLSPFEQQVLEMRLQGYSSTEIARALGTYDRKIRRVLERIERNARDYASEST